MNDMPQKYDFRTVEEGKYDFWLGSGFFASGDLSKQPFTIVIPPPNVTGKLHLGHTWDNTIQDIIIRRKRMQGFDSLYLPGMDHAGIATQARVDQKLKSLGIDRYELGREKYLEVAWKWKEEYAGYIREQWKNMGLSLDYSKERFTLDEGLSQAVEKVFISLYEKGYIYRGERIINWDVEAKTALSNIEIEHVDVEGALYYYTYPFVNRKGGLTVATTRPETMFADTALMVHPRDGRFQEYVGEEVFIPATKTRIKVIVDEYVDREFGTGVVKVTPAHDPNDFVVGKRHGLPMPLCMNEDGTMNKLAFAYEGLDRFACRKRVVEDLRTLGLLVKIEPIVHSVGHSERTGVMIEPRLSKQWFVAMKDLAQNAIDKSEVGFVPERFEKVFRHWMEEIEDWCISRQLWWGHRIPVWYKGEEIYCGHQAPGPGYTQDPDVLDTWFSSALWPFSTLGWPEDTESYRRYYPTSVLITGYDIIFFWVARMIFQAIEFTGKSPFAECLIHGLIRDNLGRKMSKSLGNGVDPIEVISEYGADSLRYFISTNSAPGMDLRYETEKVESSWNFINKLWNISRYVGMTTEGFAYQDIRLVPEEMNFADRWIIHRLNQTIRQADLLYDRYDFGEAAKIIYNFTWNDFASWYVEMSKLDAYSKVTKSVLLHTLECIIKLLHPVIPFVTEEIYQRLNYPDKSIMVSAWPSDNGMNFPETENSDWFFELIRKLRQIRNEYNVAYTKPLDILIECEPKIEEFINLNRIYLDKFVNPGKVTIEKALGKLGNVLPIVFNEAKIYLPLGSLIDIEAEKARLEKEIAELEKEIARSQSMLENENFMNKAPEAKIESERQKYALYQERMLEAKTRLRELVR